MPPPGPRYPLDRPEQEDPSVGAAVKFALTTAVIGVGFLIVAAESVSHCRVARHAAATVCSPVYRILLGLGAPTVLFIGGVWAFVRTYRCWREDRKWWAWQGAGWFLLLLMLVTLTMGLPPIAGPALGG
ncbi:MAG: hypothetical protein QOC88_3115 [Mycobacterium sp.]|jgi:hypothetical protein|nr:hypothetical protein [Mycobacterium sp.]